LNWLKAEFNSTMKKTRSGVTLLLLLVAIVIFSMHTHSLNFTQDDAYIFFRYAKNYANGHGLVFNPGERVEGYTSFSWTLIMALAIRLGLDPIFLSKILGFIFSIGSIYFLFLISELISQRRPLVFNILAVFIIACNGSFALWTLSGMETALFIFLFLVGLYAYLSERYRNTYALLTPVLFVLLSLTRPEGIFLFGLTFVHRVVSSYRSKRLDVKKHFLYLGIFVFLLLPFFLWRISFYGHPLPNTFYAKTGPSWVHLKMGLEYTVLFLRQYALWGLALIIPFCVLFFRKDRFWYGYFVALIIAFIFYIAMVGGDVLLENRFYIPVFFLMYLLVQETLYDVYLLFGKTQYLRMTPTKSVSLTCVILITVLYSAWTFHHPHTSILNSKKLMDDVVRNFSRTAHWINTQGVENASLATTGVGVVSYLADIEVIDMYGITDSYIAHHPERIEGLTSTTKEQNYNASYILSRQPTYIYFITNNKPSALAEKALFTVPEFRQRYYLYWIHHNFSIFVRKGEYRPKPLGMAAFSSVEFIEEYCKGENTKISNPEQAKRHYQKSIEFGPKDFASPYEQMGNIYLEAGLFDEAFEYYRTAIDIDDYSAFAHTGLGAIYLSKGDAERAEQELKRAVSLWPFYAPAHYYLGKTMMDRGQYDESATHLKKAIQLNRAFALPYFDLGFLYYRHLDDTPSALKYLEQYLHIQPQGEFSNVARSIVRTVREHEGSNP
jgi:arabinofuranosyltransferase